MDSTNRRSQLEDILIRDFHFLNDNNNHVLISERDCHVDGTFILHSLLSLYEKQNYKICFLALNQSMNHYVSVLKKLGTDLKSSMDSKNLIFIEGLKLLGFGALKECMNESSSLLSAQESIIPKDIHEHDSLEDLLVILKSNIDKVRSVGDGNSVVIFIDNISCLLSIGITYKNIVLFCHSLSTILKAANGTLVMLSSIYGDDDQSLYLTNYFKHISSVTVEVSSLASGYCKDVHGELEITRKRNFESKKKIQKSLQYKISDKSVSLWAIGLSSAVL